MKKWIAIGVVALAGAFAAWKSGLLPIGAQTEKRGLSSIRVPEGFEVSLASKPGLVKYPMLGTVASDGAIYMCESSGKTMQTPEMNAAPDYVVTRLTDTDGDGVYDKSTVFAEKLTLPAGAVFLKNSLYVAAPPQVYRFEDTNNDGVADVKEVLVEGWNLSANAASLHGPILGPDGWLYLTDGRHGFNITTRDGRKYTGKASRIWRLRPDGTGLEWYAGGGFDNPVEVAFTEGGDMFGTMTYFQDPRDGQRDSILHYVEGGVYPKPYPVTEEFKRTGDLMPVMTKFARVAPSGLLRYRGVSFGPEFDGNLFTAHFNSHRVLRHKVSRLGATYQTEDSDFFFSSDPDLHPTDVMEDRDGSMIVVDTGAWFIHGCPLSRVSKPDVRGILYRVRKKGATSGAPAKPALTAGVLDDANPYTADDAANEFVWKGDVATLRAFQAKTVRGATRRVFALYRIGTPEALAGVREALRDERWEVRQAAARCVGMAKDGEAVPRLMEMAAKEDPSVRRQAIAALGQIGDAKAVPALLAAAANPEDRFVEHSTIYSLIQLGHAGPLLSRLQDGSANVRKAALIALDQLDRSPIAESHVLPFLNAEEQELRRTALWVVSRHASWGPKLTQVLDARLRSPQFNEREAEMISQAMAAFCADASLKKMVGGALGDGTLDGKRQLFLLDTAERCSSKEFPAEWQTGLEKLLGHSDAGVRVRTIQLIRARAVAGLEGPLRKLAESTAQSDDVRIAALSALGGRTPHLSDSEFAYLASRLGPKVEAPAKLAAGQVLGRAELTGAQLKDVAEKYMKTADPMVIPNLLETFRYGKDEATGLMMVKSLTEVESALGSVGAQRVEEIVKKFPGGVQAAAKPLLTRLEQGKAQRLEKIRKLEGVLTANGDVAKGKAIFFGAKAGCSSCHTIGLEGGHVGPDLTSIGAIRSPHDLLEAIVLPSESFVPGHEVYRIETATEVYSGVLGRSSPDAVRLITGPGDEVRIPRSEIKSMGHAPVSLMPEGLDEVLNREEMRDLIAYLRGQIARPSEAGRSE
ncbi:MAG: HEAT repeat domain-containing protein [Acidobacteria bacterium]|nr:HEAT repeat domain-containing protein [Acidobacteriota bacterium]